MLEGNGSEVQEGTGQRRSRKLPNIRQMYESWLQKPLPDLGRVYWILIIGTVLIIIFAVWSQLTNQDSERCDEYAAKIAESGAKVSGHYDDSHNCHILFEDGNKWEVPHGEVEGLIKELE